MFYADLHIHSKFSRATSRDCDLEHLAQAAARKGIAVVGTGDFTHPGWWAELSAQLTPAEPGLYRLRPELEKKALSRLPIAQPEPVRFLLQVEIATIYKKAGRTRKVHHLIYVPELEQARKITEQLSRLGNVGSDGRPILGLDSRSLLEIVLQTGPGCFLVPAHVWTPWFSVFGAHSGFDRLEDCYEDLSSAIFALETGLSSDPPMNWRWSALDRFALVSNSDAHSPAKLGRECCVFESAKDYFAIQQALRTGQGYAGTVEFFPEEGKYHLDGHRQCGICWEPSQTQQQGGRCPQCGRPVTLGVLYRVCALADRGEPPKPGPPRAAPFRSLIPLCEILGEILQVGAESKSVQARYEELLARLGPELWILEHASVDEIARYGGPLLAEAIRRMRTGQVIRQPGFDGQYGVIRLFTDEELQQQRSAKVLFVGAEKVSRPSVPLTEGNISNQAVGFSLQAGVEASAARKPSQRFRQNLFSSTSEWLLDALDSEQRAAAACLKGPVLILAGPGTGKTRTLTHRIAYWVAEHQGTPEACLAITFSRRAAAEMAERLQSLVPECASRIPVMTFHAFGWKLLKEYAQRGSKVAFCEETLEEKHPFLQKPGRSVGGEKPSGDCPETKGPLVVASKQTEMAQQSGPFYGMFLNWAELRLASEPERQALLCELLNISPAQADRILSKISLHKRTFSSPPSSEPKLQQAVEVYGKEMARRGWVDFDDLVLLPMTLLEADPVWRAECQARYRFVSVDEFQDIDAVQYGLLRRLVPPEGNLCVIGDPDQSIYGFRGADVGFFERFLADYPTARRFVLTQNYRSSRAIVEAAGQMMAPASLAPDRKLQAKPGGPPHVEIHTCPTERAEAELVVHRIEQLLGGPTFFSLDTRRSQGQDQVGLSFSDMAVLYRTEAQAQPLVEALHRSGMPFQVCSHQPLTELPAVQKLLQTLLLHPPKDSFRLGEHLQTVLDSWEQASLEPPAAQGPEDRISSEIRAALLRLAEKNKGDFRAFLAELAMTTAADLWDSRAERISLLTLHAAKGLEFPVVFIVGCEDGLIPLRFSRQPDPAQLAEERRLLFVGMTRAQQHLILTHARRRHWQGKVRLMEPSPFLEDVQRELLAFAEHQPPSRRRPTEHQLELFD